MSEEEISQIDFETAGEVLPPLNLDRPVCCLKPAEEEHSSYDFASAEAALPPLIIPGRYPLPPNVDTLPDDVLRQIFDYLDPRKHLHDCISVNSVFHAYALPRLYKSISIDIDGPLFSLTVYKALLAKDHKGLPHIKEVCCFPPSSGEVSKEARGLIKDFLEVLPHGQLELFRWWCDWTIPLDIWKLLVRTQPNIARTGIALALDPELEPLYLDFVEELDASQLPRLHFLDLDTNSVESILVGSKILEKFDIKSLAVNGSTWSGVQPHRHAADGAVHDQLTKVLFGYRETNLYNTLQPKCSGLRRLCLEDLDLAFCRETWFKHLELVNLDELELQYCSHADVFFTELIHTQPPQLQSLTLVHDLGGEKGDRTVFDLDEFLLMSVGRLQHLELCLRNSRASYFPRWIARHRATIRSVVWDITGVAPTADRQAQHYSHFKESLVAMLEGCSKLSKLAISLPTHSLNYSDDKADDYNYEDVDDGDPRLKRVQREGEVDEFSKKNKAFVEALTAISSKVHLSTLSILNWPREFEHKQQTKAFYESVDPQLLRLANSIFNLWKSLEPKTGRRRPLEVIAFGTLQCNPKLTPDPRYVVLGQGKYLDQPFTDTFQVSLSVLQQNNMEVDVLEGRRDFGKKSRSTSICEEEI